MIGKGNGRRVAHRAAGLAGSARGAAAAWGVSRPRISPIWFNSSPNSITMSSSVMTPAILPALSTTGSRGKPGDASIPRRFDRHLLVGQVGKTGHHFADGDAAGSRFAAMIRVTRSRSVTIPTGTSPADGHDEPTVRCRIRSAATRTDSSGPARSTSRWQIRPTDMDGLRKKVALFGK